MSAAENRRIPPDVVDRVEQGQQFIYLSAADEWIEMQATSAGEVKVDLSGTEVAIQGINAAAERATIFAEQIDDPITASAVGVVTRGARALESLSADEWRAKQYAEDGAGNLHAVNAETLGSGITSGAAGVNTYADRALQSVGLDQRRVDLVSAGATVAVDVGGPTTDAIATSGAEAGLSGAIALGLGRTRQDVDVHFDVVSAGALVTDVSKISASKTLSGGPWRRFDTRPISAAEADINQMETTYRFVRAWLSGVTDADVTRLEMVAQGVS